MSQERRLARTFTIRYVIGLTLMALLSTAAFVSLRLVIASEKNAAAILNVSGLQRMLSQRSALLAEQLANSPDAARPAIRRRLAETVDLLLAHHRALIHGDAGLNLPAAMSPEIRVLYFDGDEAADRLVRRFVGLTRTLLAEPDKSLTPGSALLLRIEGLSRADLLDALDAVVSQYQREEEASVQRLRMAEDSVWLFSILLLLVEAFLIFRPFARQMSRTITDLESTRNHKETLEDLVRERTSALLAQQEQLKTFHMAVEQSPASIVITDLDGNIEYVNAAFVSNTGYRPEDVLGKNPRLLQSGKTARETYRALWDTITAGGSWRGELVNRRKDGSGYVESAVIAPVRQADGSVSHYVAIKDDITARKTTEQALLQSEAKFHTMVDWTIDWEYWVNPDGSFNYLTPSAESLTGYRAEEFERNPSLLDRIVHPDDKAHWQEHLLNHLHTDENPEVVELDYRLVRKQGDTIWVTHSCRPIYGGGGEYLGRRVTMRDISKHKAAEAEIQHLAYFDPLTGLPNRSLLNDRLRQALVASRRTAEYGVLMLLDLDHFKKINDTRGHDVGDRLLVQVADRLKMTLRQEDTAARLGGDEFVVMVERLGDSEFGAAHKAEHLATKLLDALRKPYQLEDGVPGYISTASVGLTLFKGQESSVDQLFKQADVALYQAKGGGRNAIRFFNPAMQADIERRTALENALRHGLANCEFALHYQPQVDSDGTCIGAEALVRWASPERGMVSPAEFIPLAEESGLIVELGQWVLDAACAQLRRWQDVPGMEDLRLAVNVSAKQFHQPDFIDLVRSSLAASGADPRQLKLELTESVILENVDLVIARMNQLNDMGVCFSLDDFGTGYSSLSYLKRLPLSQIKIDQSFVRDIPGDRNDAAIVEAILAMSRSLRLHVIAEGVETVDQKDFLHRHGCMAYQGYLFGRPLPVDEFVAHVSAPVANESL
ncbi:MAG TPA: EAL domain-containing protein [Parasulfuritortus sp.]